MSHKIKWLLVAAAILSQPGTLTAYSFQFKPRIPPRSTTLERTASDFSRVAGTLYVLESQGNLEDWVAILRAETGHANYVDGFIEGSSTANRALTNLQKILNGRSYNLGSEAGYQVGWRISCNPAVTDSCPTAAGGDPTSSPAVFTYAAIGTISFDAGQNPVDLFHLRPTTEGWPTIEDALPRGQRIAAGATSDSISPTAGSYILWVSQGRRYIGPRNE